LSPAPARIERGDGLMWPVGAGLRNAAALARAMQGFQQLRHGRCPMLANATGDNGTASAMAVWIEQSDGTIVRGLAQTVSARGACVRLAEPHEFRPDEDVTLRICFSSERPTIAASAHVRWARRLGDAVECGLDWDLGTSQLEAQPA
jgi:PilZ domain